MRKLILVLIVAAATTFVIGFVRFATGADGLRAPDPAPQADAIVALTGGAGRVKAAVGLLEAGAGQRLLISGVHPDSQPEDVRALSGGEAATFDCCVDFGRSATSTTGNARETAEWARANGFDHLIVVTSDFHMQRSLIMLTSVMPGVALTPYPVASRSDGAWWTDAGFLRRSLVEYGKYLVARLVVGSAATSQSGPTERQP